MQIELYTNKNNQKSNNFDHSFELGRIHALTGHVLLGGGGGGGVGGCGGVRLGGLGLGGGSVRVDVKAMLGVGGDVGYGGCEPRVEGIVQGTKRYCSMLRK